MSLPIRVRLTAWYAALLAVILLSLGTFVVLRVRSDLHATIDREVRSSSTKIASAYLTEGGDEFRDVTLASFPSSSSGAQVLDSSGRVLRSSGGPIAVNPMVSPATRAQALAGGHALIPVHLGRASEPFLVMATPLRVRGRSEVLVVGESLQGVDQAVHRVLLVLLLAGPAALAATALGGWWLARKALLPVRRMTTQAKQISIDQLGERIASPRTTDEIGNLAVTLNMMLDRLEHGVREKHRLIADASHELRTPLAVMRTELDVSLRADDLSPDARAVLGSAREEVARMTRTVNNLLTLAQVDEGRLALLTTHLDLRDAIRDATGPLAPLAAAKRIQLAVGGDSCEAQADPHRIHQALTNFIENAIKFSRPGSTVHASTWQRDQHVGITVTDEGPGIPGDACAHIFDRFYRVDRARGREDGGSGLGLAICREIVVAHGGEVWVESEEGAGSAFSLSLPRTRPS